MIELAADLDDPISRAQLPGHFTASALVVDPAVARTCLVDHEKLGRFLQPGGHVEPEDESPLAAALREAREETGLDVRAHPFAPRPLDVDVHEIPAVGDEPSHLHLDLRYLLLADGGEPADGAAWLPLGEAVAAVDEPGFARLVAKARRFGA